MARRPRGRHFVNGDQHWLKTPRAGCPAGSLRTVGALVPVQKSAPWAEAPHFWTGVAVRWSGRHCIADGLSSSTTGPTISPAIAISRAGAAIAPGPHPSRRGATLHANRPARRCFQLARAPPVQRPERLKVAGLSNAGQRRAMPPSVFPEVIAA
jgi:hypothetical protein